MTCFFCKPNNCKVCDGTCGLCGQLCPGYIEPPKKNCDGCDDCKCDETEKGKEL